MIFTHDDVKQFLNSLTDDDLLALRSRFKEILSPLPANTYTVDDLATSKKQPTQRHRAHTNPGRI